jgi:hypothetical protein
MVIDEAHSLHEGVACCGADEFPTAFFEVF